MDSSLPPLRRFAHGAAGVGRNPSPFDGPLEDSLQDHHHLAYGRGCEPVRRQFRTEPGDRLWIEVA